MSRFFIQMAFDGTHYSGWQIQSRKVTVQKILVYALSTLLKQEISVTGAGRTDRGVHASYYIAHFDAELPLKSNHNVTPDSFDPSSGQFIFKLNRFLPPDIVVYKIFKVSQEMHARFSATYRTYHYHITSFKPLFNRNYSHYVYGKLNTELIKSCCKVITETTDFTSFAKLHSDVKSNICLVTHAVWRDTKEGYCFEITADRFLRNMVRSLTGTLLDAGFGKLDLEGFKAIVEAKDRGKAGASAPAQGLFLVDIGYAQSESHSS